MAAYIPVTLQVNYFWRKNIFARRVLCMLIQLMALKLLGNLAVRLSSSDAREKCIFNKRLISSRAISFLFKQVAMGVFSKKSK